MKVEFPLWLVTNPNLSEGLSDICKHFTNFGEMEHFIETTSCPNGALYTNEAEARADAQERISKRDRILAARAGLCAECGARSED